MVSEQEGSGKVEVQILAMPRLVRRKVAEVYVGGAVVLQELEEEGLVQPARQTARSALYDSRDLDAAVDAARGGIWAAS